VFSRFGLRRYMFLETCIQPETTVHDRFFTIVDLIPDLHTNECFHVLVVMLVLSRGAGSCSALFEHQNIINLCKIVCVYMSLITILHAYFKNTQITLDKILSTIFCCTKNHFPLLSFL
jgi:hypothetical protein